ncbi:MAG: response regulator, partial [Bdellovibrionales bacterium]|nr:response regulator [Bdellovibrionales bacterium]
RPDVEFLFFVYDELPRFVVGDQQKLRQILVNLTSNAFKFADQDGAVLFRVDLAHAQDAGVQIWFGVSNAGVGMASQGQPQLSAVFEQPDDMMSGRSGEASLGLAIASELVQLLGGNLGVDSRVGIGSRFEVLLPFQRGSQAQADEELEQVPFYEHDAQADRGFGDRPRILVADDNEINLRLIAKILESIDCDLSFASDGLEVLKRSTEQQFDLILMDIQMPGMDGMDTVHHIRSDEANLNIETPVIAVTAHAMEGDEERYLDFGMDGYVTKPINRKKLLRTVSKQLSLEFDDQNK